MTNTSNVEKQKKYLDKYIFQGLKNLNTGFDVQGLKYFSEREFQIVLERVKDKGLSVLGIEPFKNDEYYGTYLCDIDYKKKPNDPTWYQQAFEDFKKRDKSLMYAASFSVSEDLLKEFDSIEVK